MYIGRYYHRLESKNRVSLPVKFREKVKTGGVITRGLDGCLYIFDQETWNKRVSTIANLSETKKSHRDYIRFLTNDAQELEIDGQGRIHLTEELKNQGKLTKAVVFVGSLDHIEMWDQEKYHEYVEQLEGSIEATVEATDQH